MAHARIDAARRAIDHPIPAHDLRGVAPALSLPAHIQRDASLARPALTRVHGDLSRVHRTFERVHRTFFDVHDDVSRVQQTFFDVQQTFFDVHKDLLRVQQTFFDVHNNVFDDFGCQKLRFPRLNHTPDGVASEITRVDVRLPRAAPAATTQPSRIPHAHAHKQMPGPPARAISAAPPPHTPPPRRGEGLWPRVERSPATAGRSATRGEPRARRVLPRRGSGKRNSSEPALDRCAGALPRSAPFAPPGRADQRSRPPPRVALARGLTRSTRGDKPPPRRGKKPHRPPASRPHTHPPQRTKRPPPHPTDDPPARPPPPQRGGGLSPRVKRSPARAGRSATRGKRRARGVLRRRVGGTLALPDGGTFPVRRESPIRQQVFAWG